MMGLDQYVEEMFRNAKENGYSLAELTTAEIVEEFMDQHDKINQYSADEVRASVQNYRDRMGS